MTARAWAGTNFKDKRTPARVLRRRKADKAKRIENANKAEVRERENHKCRFPWCTCHRFGLFLEVSHKEHKGMGGNPAGDRSAPELMLLICNERHKESPISIDKGTLRWEQLTAAGANGPIAWWLDVGALSDGMIVRGTWRQIASEDSPGVLKPLTENNRAILLTLGAQITRKFR